MNSAQRTEFRDLLEKLYAGFNMPISEARHAAYWEGLAKMSLGQFAAAVEYALGEHGPERIPAAPALWKLAQAARARTPAPIAPPVVIEPQNLPLRLVNGLFLKYLWRRRSEGFKGNLDIAARRTECLSLVTWLENWTEAELKTERREIGRLFDVAMAKVQDKAA